MYRPLSALRKTVKNFFNPKKNSADNKRHDIEKPKGIKKIRRSRDEWNAINYAKRLSKFGNIAYRKAPAIDKSYRTA